MTRITNDTPIWFALARQTILTGDNIRAIIAISEERLYAKAAFFGWSIMTHTIDHYSSASDMMDEGEQALWEMEESE
tara:strand:- start:346 stop:576 length:231 start_codon:yes stop_codon:yes gene_type:complete